MPATKLAFSSRPTPVSWTPSFLVGEEAEALEQCIYRKISERAYFLFEQSGREPGNDQTLPDRACKLLLGRPGCLFAQKKLATSRILKERSCSNERSFSPRIYQLKPIPFRLLLRSRTAVST